MPSGISTPRRRLLVVAAATIMAAAAGAVAFASQRETDRPAEDAPPPPPPEALAQATRDLDLPVSTSVRKEHAPGAVSVLVTRRQLLVGGDPNPLADFPEGLAALATTGLPARFKRSGAGDFHVPELASELSYFYLQGRVRDEPPALAVLADAATPYSVLSEILSTAAWSGFDDVELAVRGHDASLAWLASPMKRPRSPRSIDIWRARAPDLFVTGDGFSLRWGRGKPAPGCDPRAAGALVPKAGGAYDPRALAECLRRVKTGAPQMAREGRLVLHVSPEVDLQTLVSVLDAALATDEGAPRWTDISFEDGDPAAPVADDEDRYVRPPRALGPTGKGPIGNAAIGGSLVSGGKVANAPAVVAGMAAGFRRCYNKGLVEDPKMMGSVRITAKIGPNGEVLGVSPSGSGLSGTVVSCIAARVSSAQFAPPDGGGATIVIPVTFVSQ